MKLKDICKLPIQNIVENAETFIKQIEDEFPDSEVAWSNGNTVVVKVNKDLEMYQDDMNEINAEFSELGFKEDVDYDWMIAMGDDGADSIALTNAMLDNESVKSILHGFAGPGIYS